MNRALQRWRDPGHRISIPLALRFHAQMRPCFLHMTPIVHCWINQVSTCSGDGPIDRQEGQ